MAMKFLRPFLFFITLYFSTKTFAVEITSITCDPARSEAHQVVLEFVRPVDPLKPFLGFLYFSAKLSVYKNSAKVYENPSIRLSPEVYTTDINLFGEASGVYLRLYPQTDSVGQFTNYTGKLFINDLDVKAYFNFNDVGDQPGLHCY